MYIYLYIYTYYTYIHNGPRACTDTPAQPARGKLPARFRWR